MKHLAHIPEAKRAQVQRIIAEVCGEWTTLQEIRDVWGTSFVRKYQLELAGRLYRECRLTYRAIGLILDRENERSIRDIMRAAGVRNTSFGGKHKGKVNYKRGCNTCLGQSWHRAKPTCHECGKPYAEETIKRRPDAAEDRTVW